MDHFDIGLIWYNIANMAIKQYVCMSKVENSDFLGLKGTKQLVH